MNIIDLFAGAGGLSEGFRNDKFNILFHIEMDSDASETLKTREAYYYLKNNDQLNHYYDYLNKRISKEELYKLIPREFLDSVLNVEISDDTIEKIFNKIDDKLQKEQLNGIVGGPPCQAFSMIGRVSNKDKKSDDKRIYLYEYYVDFLKRYKPDFFVFENVKGLLSFKDENNELLLPKIIKAFEEVGYSIQKDIIDTSEYYVPQNRERLFVFGFKKEFDQVNFFEELAKEKKTPITLQELFEDLPIIKHGEENNEYRMNATSRFVIENLRSTDAPLTFNIARPHNERDLSIYKIVAEAKREGRQIRYFDLPSKLKTHKSTDVFTDRFKALKYDDYSHTIVAHIAKDGHYYIHPDVKQNRSITVREAARIQTFPDDFFFEGSRSSAFKQIGNAVPPILSKKIANTISRIKETAK